MDKFSDTSFQQVPLTCFITLCWKPAQLLPTGDKYVAITWVHKLSHLSYKAHTDQKFRLRMKCSEVIFSYLTRSWTHIFCDCEDECLWDRLR